MNHSTNPSFMVNGSQKIQPLHRQRLACIYVRQSSLKQVRENTESQVNQYRLEERAKALGWPENQIRVIDSDQGISGTSSNDRLGFQEILSLVSMSQVGIIFGYEVSRIARNNADWYPLLQLADVFGVLIADNDAIYDPKDFNDRMVLGLKGTMSELELHLIRQRLDTGRMNKIMRAEYRQPLPTGLVRGRDNVVYKDPDMQVQSMIQLILDKFAEFGTCPKVFKHCLDNKILFPRRQMGGAHHGEILWREPSYTVINSILKNPAYAGAFAHGRTQVDPAKRLAFGSPNSGRKTCSMDEWIHLQQDVYPAYISWEQYLANQERLRQNAASFEKAIAAAQGAAREGKALLQGLVKCGCCARRMHIRYRSTTTYACSELYDTYGRKSCLFVTAPKIDEIVVQAFFEAIQPAQLDALAALLDQQQQDHAKLDQQWQQRLQRADYEAQRAERQYNQADPENRLVTASLEKRWEEMLITLHETQREYQLSQQQQATPSISPQLQQQFQHISETLPDLWPQLSYPDQKELLRTLISQVILTPRDKTSIEVKIVWLSAHYSLFSADRPFQRWADVPHFAAMIQRIRQLWEHGTSDTDIADILNSEHFTAMDGSDLTRVTIRNLRLKQGWSVKPASAKTPPKVDGKFTTRGLALECNTDKEWIRTRIFDGTIPFEVVSRHPHQRCYLIDASDHLIQQLKAKAALRKRYNTRKPKPPNS
ncbi:recombinase family protein [Chloroflexi bacterium TSY]|nr:recombinase family protein [Chloroflexi bacterium TSY]